MKFIYFNIFITFLLSDAIQIDASDWDEWVYINLSLALINGVGVVDPGESPEDNLGWDIACKRYHFRTNSGLSGNGNGGAYVDSINTWNSNVYNPLIQVPENSYFERDTIVNTFYSQEDGQNVYGLPGIANPSLETWGWINTDDNYTMNYTDHQFIVRSATGDKFYKLWAVNYYNQNNTSGYISIYFDEISECIIGHDNCGECGGDSTSCSGCTDDIACNYDQMAFIDSGCEYPLENYDCNSQCIENDNDDDGICDQDDICPYVYDPYQSDRDQDELGDACDDDDDDADGLIDCWDYWYSDGIQMSAAEIEAAIESGSCQDSALGYNKAFLPSSIELVNIFPNPFNPYSMITFNVSSPQIVNIDIYDINGHKISDLTDRFYNSGMHNVEWEPDISISSGLYIVHFQTLNFQTSKKILYLK